MSNVHTIHTTKSKVKHQTLKPKYTDEESEAPYIDREDFMIYANDNVCIISNLVKEKKEEEANAYAYKSHLKKEIQEKEKEIQEKEKYKKLFEEERKEKQQLKDKLNKSSKIRPADKEMMNATLKYKEYENRKASKRELEEAYKRVEQEIKNKCL